jgi:tetratricopeptide (TPR) repeat protein
VAFTPDRRALVSGSEDGRITLWDLGTRKPRAVLSQPAAVLGVAVSPDGRRVATAGWDGKVRLWDLAGGKLLHELKGHTEHVLRVAFTPDGKRVVSAGDDGTIKFWDLTMLQEVFTLRGNTAGIGSLALRADGKVLVAGAADGTVRLWSAEEKGADRRSVAAASSPGALCAWHLAEAMDCLQGGQRRAADFHLERLLGSPLPEEVFAAGPAFRHDLAAGHSQVAALLERAGRREEAEQACRGAVRLRTTLAEEFPDRADYRRELAGDHGTLATILWHARRLPEAEAAHRQALRRREELVALFAGNPDYRSELGSCLHNLALVLRDRGDLEEAGRLLEKAVACQRAALKLHPHHPGYRWSCSVHLRTLAQTQVHAGNHRRAAAAAEEALALGPGGWQPDHLFARLLARCASLAEKDDRLPVDRRKELAARYAGRAVELPRAAVGKGFRDAAGLEHDPWLEALRGREDFRKLLREMGEKGKAAGNPAGTPKKPPTR